jgi:acyl-homoserine lactone acylase PvdQ
MLLRSRQSFSTLLLLAFLLPIAGSSAQKATSKDPDAGKVVVYRDEYGVPHIYAPTIEGGIYAMGYTEAEDRLEELLKNYMRAMGEMSGAFGSGELIVDLQSHLFRHYEIAHKNYERIRPHQRRVSGADGDLPRPRRHGEMHHRPRRLEAAVVDPRRLGVRDGGQQGEEERGAHRGG